MSAQVEQYLSPKEACDHLGIARRTLGRYIAIGVIPEPMRLTARTLRWRLKDLEAAMEKLTTPSRQRVTR